MSAFICDKGHFVYLVKAAAHISRFSFSWYHDNKSTRLNAADREQLADVANMLYRENLASVSYRYPGDKTSATLPGPCVTEAITARDFLRPIPHIKPVQVLKSISCLEYQSCEHPGWKESEAYTFLRSLEQSAINALPGYEDAPWGFPENR
jgi:hypothetical protein